MKKTAEYIAEVILVKVAEEEHPGMRAARGVGGLAGGTVGGVAGGVVGAMGGHGLRELLGKVHQIHGGGPLGGLSTAGTIGMLGMGALGAGTGALMGSGDALRDEVDGEPGLYNRWARGTAGGAVGGAAGTGLSRLLESRAVKNVIRHGKMPSKLVQALMALSPLVGAGVGAAAGSGALSPKQEG